MKKRSLLKRTYKKGKPEINALRRHITDLEAKHKATIEEYLINRHFPFMEDILVEPLPENLKITQLIGYDGEGDPLNHLEKYISWMEL